MSLLLKGSFFTHLLPILTVPMYNQIKLCPQHEVVASTGNFGFSKIESTLSINMYPIKGIFEEFAFTLSWERTTEHHTG